MLAVYREAKRAIEKARDGGGPTLIECLTLRMEGHAVHDDAFYVPKELFEEWAKRDPIERFRTWLRENADLTDEEEDEISARRQEAPERRDPARRGVAAARPVDADRGRLRDARGPRHAPPQVMAELTYLQAISDGLRTEMRRDKRVFVIGEDVGVYGGAFKVTLGFQEEFGPWRVIDAPLSETAIVGGCTGAAIMGMRPVAEMQFADFVSCAWDHLVTVAAKQRYRAGTPVPIVVRLPSGGGFSGGPFHSQNPESSFAHIPGLKCVCPATPEDAKGLLVSAIEDPNPVLYFEHKHLYRRIKGEVPEERYTVPIGKARTHREGEDVTRDHLGRDGLHGRRGGEAARGGRRLGRDRRPAHGACRGTRRPCSQRCARRRRCSSSTRTRAPAASAPRSRRRSPRRRSRISTRR